jgi:anti-anti-sigma regulatory factor
MQFTTIQVQGRVPVTALKMDGRLDGTSYLDAIAVARDLYDRGARYIVLDLSDVPYVSSAGLVAIQSIAALFRGEQPPDPEMGWQAFHAVERDLDAGMQNRVKLLSPQPQVQQVLETVGFTLFLEVHPTLEEAVSGF